MGRGVSLHLYRQALVQRMPVHVHTALLDAVVIIGGVVMIAGAFR